MECGDACTPQQVEAARQRLIVQAMRQTDSRWNSILGMGGLVAQDGNAQSFLSSITQTKGNYTDFGADWAQYNDHSMFADALRGKPALDQVYGAVLRTATSQDDQRHLLQALNRTDAGWTDDYVHGVLNRDAWAIGTTFTGDVGFVADVTHKLATGDEKGALSAVAGAVVLSKVGELGGIVAGKAVTIIKEALNSTKGASDSVLPLVVKETATTGTAGEALTEVPLLKPEAPNPKSVVDVPRGNEIDTSGLAGFPEVPPGYSTLKSGGAAANETGGLPDGFRRVLNNEGDVVIQSSNGVIYKEVDVSAGQKGGWNKDLNKPEPNTIYNVDGNKVYRTNANGDVEYVEASLSLSNKDRNTSQQCKAGKCGLADDEGGHLVASIFDEPGEKLNLVPMNSNLNKGAWKAMENEWAGALREGKSVKIKIEPSYTGSGRPDKFNVTYQIGSEPPVVQTFRNSPKGI
nr:DNA/RNA non-specific endonuclease [Xanthomonas sacchari]